MLRGGRRLSPIALYALLLIAAAALAMPEVPRRVQAAWLALASLPLRAGAGFAPEVVAAEADASAVAERVAARCARLVARHETAALAGHAAFAPAGFAPVVVRVRAVEGRGAAGVPTRLVIDYPVAALRDCLSFVTFGDVLVGFVVEPEDRGGASPQSAAVEVGLLHDRRDGTPRRIVAAAALADGDLRFVLEPAGSVDRWPLRCRTVEDPYRLSRLTHSGQPVRTAAIADDPLGAVPAGLNVGTLELWGYPGLGAIDVFVAPARDPETLSSVVLWRRQAAGPATGLAPAGRHGVRAVTLPGADSVPAHWLLRAADGLTAGAAVVEGERLRGIVSVAFGGFGLGAPFGRRGARWALTLLPRATGEAPMDFVARVASEQEDPPGQAASSAERYPRRWVRLLPEADQPLTPAVGELFTAVNGRACPPGLWIGDAVVRPSALAPAGYEVWVRLPQGDPPGPAGLQVCRPEARS